jgi:hypothetical protein
MKKIILFITLINFIACDCIRPARGVVIDEITKQPIEGVLVQNNNRSIKTMQDGRFDVSMITGFILYRCPDIKVTFTKSDYQTLEIINPKKDTILLMKKIP